LQGLTVTPQINALIALELFSYRWPIFPNVTFVPFTQNPYLWAKNITVTGNTVTKWEFDQFSGYLSYTQMAVNNNATVPS